MVKYLLVNAVIFLTFLSIAQTDNKDVIITSSGSGTSQEQAKQTALRNAIEQAFGTFISSKTEILNDEIVADQMSSVSSGNIKSYEVLNESQLPNGSWVSTLRVLVSVDKLKSFVEAKGITVEIKGGLFALNIKQQLLNEQGEINAIANMVGILHEVMQTAFDYTIKSGDPKSLDAESKNWEIPLTIDAIANKNMDFCKNYFLKTCISLGLEEADIQSYKTLNKEVYAFSVNYSSSSTTVYLRNIASINLIDSFIGNWEFYIRLYSINSGLEVVHGKGSSKIPKFGEYGYGFLMRDIYFPPSGQIVSTFSYKDIKILNQIEKINGYTIKPRGIISLFKNGGYLVYEKNGHGLVSFLRDLDNQFCQDWTTTKFTCEDLNSNGYNDWRLPTIEELSAVNESLFKDKIGNFDNNPYWSSIEINDQEVYVYDFEQNRNIEKWKTDQFYTRTRCVRTY